MPRHVMLRAPRVSTQSHELNKRKTASNIEYQEVYREIGWQDRLYYRLTDAELRRIVTYERTLAYDSLTRLRMTERTAQFIPEHAATSVDDLRAIAKDVLFRATIEQCSARRNKRRFMQLRSEPVRTYAHYRRADGRWSTVFTESFVPSFGPMDCYATTALAIALAFGFEWQRYVQYDYATVQLFALFREDWRLTTGSRRVVRSREAPMAVAPVPPPPPLPQEAAASDNDSDQVARVEPVQAPKASDPPQLRSFSRRRRRPAGPGHSVTRARRRTEPADENRDDNIESDEVFEDELRDDSNVEEDSSSDEEEVEDEAEDSEEEEMGPRRSRRLRSKTRR
jgi:hypothetical protein